MGLSTFPWRIPPFTADQSENTPQVFTCCLRSDKKWITKSVDDGLVHVQLAHFRYQYLMIYLVECLAEIKQE